MNILTLSIKQKYFDEILAGKKTHGWYITVGVTQTAL